MKKILKKILSFALIYLGITLLFVSLIIGSYMLPDTNIRGHVAESIEQLKTEGNGYAPFFRQPGATLDTHTDSLMLNIALNKGINENQRTIEKAVENSFYEDNISAVTALEKNIEDNNINNHEYSRYWHGVQVFLRPLLLFFNYTEIRYILMIIIISLLGLTFSMIGNQLSNRYVFAFAITICLMFVILIPVSLQYSSIFIITLISMISVISLYKYNKQKYISILFFLIGAFSTYFDLLTYPLITLGLPLVLAVLLENKNKNLKVINQLFFIVKLGLLWGIGYGLLFFTKWVIASIILQKNVVNLAIDQLLFRVNGNETYPVNRLEVIKNNFNYFYVPIAKYILSTIFVIWGILMIFFRKKLKNLIVVVPLICIAIVPYIWYILFAGHSSIHCWFTNKIQAMSLFAILCSMCYTIDFTNFKSIVEKIKEKKK